MTLAVVVVADDGLLKLPGVLTLNVEVGVLSLPVVEIVDETLNSDLIGDFVGLEELKGVLLAGVETGGLCALVECGATLAAPDCDCNCDFDEGVLRVVASVIV